MRLAVSLLAPLVSYRVVRFRVTGGACGLAQIASLPVNAASRASLPTHLPSALVPTEENP